MTQGSRSRGQNMRSRAFSAAVVVSLLGLLSAVLVVGFESAASASPLVTSVTIGGTEAAPIVTVNGSGFGANPTALGTAFGIPAYCGAGFTGNDYGTNFNFRDNSNVAWQAGRGAGAGGDNCIGVLFSSYSDTQVVFSFGTYYYPGSSYQLLSGDAFTMNVLGATFSGSVPAIVPAVSPPVSNTVTAAQDAVWSVTISNPYSAPLTGVTATLSAAANGSTPLAFVDADMPSCTPQAGNTDLCNLADVPANSTEVLNVFVPTTGLTVGTTIAGTISVHSTSLFTAVSGTLGTVTRVSCGAACVVAVATPGTPVASSSNPPTAGEPDEADRHLARQQFECAADRGLVEVDQPRPRDLVGRQAALPSFGIKCTGQISVIGGNFKPYNNRAHPIKVGVDRELDDVRAEGPHHHDESAVAADSAADLRREEGPLQHPVREARGHHRIGGAPQSDVDRHDLLRRHRPACRSSGIEHSRRADGGEGDGREEVGRSCNGRCRS